MTPLLNRVAIERVIKTASLAPRLESTEGWHFVVAGPTLLLRAPDAVSLPTAAARRLRINCGAAVEFARSAIKALGYECVVRIRPDATDRTLMATLTVGGRTVGAAHRREGAEVEALVGTATEGRFRSALPKDIVEKVRRAADDRRCWIRVVGDDIERHLGSLLTAAMPEKDMSSPPEPDGLLVLLGSDDDEAADQVRIGRALANLMLVLGEARIDVDLGRPVAEIPGASAELSRSLGLISSPQLLLRIRPSVLADSAALGSMSVTAS